jgi:hypothetical protein
LYLRKGFEVCGILEDVYVAKKRNRFGEPYGFVKFSNVKDVTKLTKALNVVWFGHFRVRASVAKIERSDTGAERRLEDGQAGKMEGDGDPSKQGKAGHKQTTSKTKRDNTGGPDLEKKGTEVQVGDIVVKLGDRQHRAVRQGGQKHGEGQVSKAVGLFVDAVKEGEKGILLRNFRSKVEDVLWAHKGLVATVINGEAVSVVQNRITDARFSDLVLTPMGADKVFIRCTKGKDAMSVVGGAEEFFKLVFSSWTSWDKDQRPYQRGAWVRLYGVPQNAWNVDFFKLCVFDCGRFLRADSCSADKDRLDFARVLIATADLDIVTKLERVLVDGAMVEIKIVEEWGYAMGEDTCLFEEEDGSEQSQAGDEAGHDEPEVRRNVDVLVEKIVDTLEAEDDDAVQRKCGRETKPVDTLFDDGESQHEDARSVEVLSPVFDPVQAQQSPSVGTPGVISDQNMTTDDSSDVLERRDNHHVEDGSGVGL